MQFRFNDKVIGFNSEWVAGQSLASFSKHEKHHGLTSEQFTEVYELCKAKHKDSSFGRKDSPAEDGGFE